jgi:hypothetical protein
MASSYVANRDVDKRDQLPPNDEQEAFLQFYEEWLADISNRKLTFKPVI